MPIPLIQLALPGRQAVERHGALPHAERHEEGPEDVRVRILRLLHPSVRRTSAGLV